MSRLCIIFWEKPWSSNMITVFSLQNGFINIAQSIRLPLYHTHDTKEFCNVFNIFINDWCNWNRVSYQLDYITQGR